MSNSKKRVDYIPGTNLLWVWRICPARAFQSTPIPGGMPALSVRITRIMSMGYNGFPKGCSDDEFPWGREQEADDPYSTKYLYVTHSELNAILNYRGGSLEGSKIYVTLFPCNECAKAIIQAGIKTIIYKEDKYPDSPSVRASKRMLNAAGVRYYQYDQTGRKIEIDV